MCTPLHLTYAPRSRCTRQQAFCPRHRTYQEPDYQVVSSLSNQVAPETLPPPKRLHGHRTEFCDLVSLPSVEAEVCSVLCFFADFGVVFCMLKEFESRGSVEDHAHAGSRRLEGWLHSAKRVPPLVVAGALTTNHVCFGVAPPKVDSSMEEIQRVFAFWVQKRRKQDRKPLFRQFVQRKSSKGERLVGSASVAGHM